MARLTAEVVCRKLDVHTPNSGRILNVSTFLPHGEARNIGDLVVVTYPKSVGGLSTIELYGSNGRKLAAAVSRNEILDLTALATATSEHVDSLDCRLVASTVGNKLEIFDTTVALVEREDHFDPVSDGSLFSKSKGPFSIPRMRTIFCCDDGEGKDELYGLAEHRLLRLDSSWITGAGGGMNLAIPSEELDGSTSEKKIGFTYLRDERAELVLPYLFVRGDERATYLEAIGRRAASTGDGTSALPYRVEIEGEGDYDSICPVPGGRGLLALADGRSHVAYLALTDFGYALEIGRISIDGELGFTHDPNNTTLAPSVSLCDQELGFYLSTKSRAIKCAMRIEQ